MNNVENLITNHIDTWTSAINTKTSSGRGSDTKHELYGIKKLRELIFDLAIRGLLVAQNPNDEPASVLLEKVQERRQKLINDKKIKKQKNFPPIKKEEVPFNLPNGWLWARFGDCAVLKSGCTFSKERELEQGKVPYCKVADMNIPLNQRELLTSSRFINPSDKDLTQLIPSGSIVFPKRGGAIATNKKRYVNKPLFVDPNVMAATPHSPLVLGYVMTWLSSIDLASLNTGTSVPQINNKDIEPLLFPCPPADEQVRIVAKLEELIALCDQLEKQADSSIDAHKALVSTLLKSLTDSAASNENGAEKFQQAWERIAEHFDVLFTNENSVDQLKQTILQLAVMGKLVPQDQNEEPASVLLEKIAIEKSQLIKDKKIKKQKPLAAIEDDEKLFKIPEAWTWAKVGNLGVLKGGFAYKSKEFVEDSKHQLIRMGNIRPDFLRINENPVFISEDQALATKDYEIASGDILLTMTGTKGKRDYLYSLKVSTKDLMEKSLYLNQRLCAVRPLVIEPSYINLVLKDDRMLDAIYAKSTGSANQANIGMDAIMNWTIPLPSLQDQRNIVNKVQELWTTCDFLKVKLSKIQSLKLTITDALATVK